jgi:hypothetical protein
VSEDKKPEKESQTENVLHPIRLSLCSVCQTTKEREHDFSPIFLPVNFSPVSKVVTNFRPELLFPPVVTLCSSSSNKINPNIFPSYKYYKYTQNILPPSMTVHLLYFLSIRFSLVCLPRPSIFNYSKKTTVFFLFGDAETLRWTL